MTTKGMWAAAALTAAFAVISCSAMLYRAGTKTIRLEDTVHAQEENYFEDTDSGEFDLSVKRTAQDPEAGMTLVIPVPQGTGSADVRLEDRYLYRQLIITIDGSSADYYTDRDIESSLGDELISAGCKSSGGSGSVKLMFQLGSLLANESSLDSTGGKLVVSFFVPSERYRHVVVVDATDDNTGALISSLLNERMDKVPDIKVYYTALPGWAADTDLKLLLMQTSGADMFVQVGEKRGAVNGISAWYNGQFYIRGFGNVMLADTLERSTAQSAGWNAAGIFEEDDTESMLYKSRVASAFISAGNPDDDDDAVRLKDNGYLTRVADGIAAGIQAAAGAMDEASLSESGKNAGTETDTDRKQGIKEEP